MKKLLMLLLVLLIPFVTATDYYIDCNATSNGDGSQVSPFWNITNVNDAMSGTDKAFFKAGSICRTPTHGYPLWQSGNSSHWNTWTSYGTGQAKIYGSIISNSSNDWTNVSANLWMYKNTFSSSTDSDEVGQIYYNVTGSIGVLHRNWSIAQITSGGQGYYYSNTSGNNSLYIYSTSNPFTYYGNMELAMGQTMFSNYVSWGRDYINVSNLDLRFGANHAIDISSAASNPANWCYFANNTIAYIGGHAWGSDGSPARRGNGIQLWREIDNCLIMNNTLYEVWDAALTSQASDTASVGYGVGRNQSFIGNVVYNSVYGYEIFQNDLDEGGLSNVTVDHNTFIDNGYTMTITQRDETVETVTGKCLRTGSGKNITTFRFTNNICYEAVNYLVGSPPTNGWTNGNYSNVVFDYNFYYKNTSRIEGLDGETTDLFSWYGTDNFSIPHQYEYFNTTGYNYVDETLQDQNSLFGILNFVNKENNDYTPTYNVPLCTMSSSDGYIGALPCQESCVVPYCGMNITTDTTFCTTNLTCNHTTDIYYGNQSVISVYGNVTLDGNGTILSAGDYYYPNASTPNKCGVETVNFGMGNVSNIYNLTIKDFNVNFCPQRLSGGTMRNIVLINASDHNILSARLQNVVFDNVRLYNSSNSGFYFYGESGSYNTSNVTIMNSLFNQSLSNNCLHINMVGTPGTGMYNVVKNNLFANCPTSTDVSGTYGLIYQNNTFINGTGEFIVVTRDPSFGSPINASAKDTEITGNTFQYQAYNTFYLLNYTNGTYVHDNFYNYIVKIRLTYGVGGVDLRFNENTNQYVVVDYFTNSINVNSKVWFNFSGRKNFTLVNDSVNVFSSGVYDDLRFTNGTLIATDFVNYTFVASANTEYEVGSFTNSSCKGYRGIWCIIGHCYYNNNECSEPSGTGDIICTGGGCI